MDWDHDGSTLTPEEQLRRSAPPRQRSQLPEAPPPSRWHQAWRLHRQRWQDRWVGWKEAWHRRWHHGPSLRAQTEGLAYYGERYRAQGPDPLAFALVLRRNGIPDWANPYPEGQAEHYWYHPLGLMAADLERLLEGVQSDWQAAQDAVAPASVLPQGPEREADTNPAFVSEPLEGPWITIDQAMSQNETRQARQRARQREAVRACWALVVRDGRPLGRLAREVHAANLHLATVDVLLHLPAPEARRLPRYIRHALRQGLLPPGSPNRWLQQVQKGRQKGFSALKTLTLEDSL